MGFIHIPKSQMAIAASPSRTDSTSVNIGNLGAGGYSASVYYPYTCYLPDFTRMITGLGSFSTNGANVAPSTFAGIRFFKGSIPAASDIRTNSAFNTSPTQSTDWTYRSTDRLLSLPIQTSTSYSINSSSQVTLGFQGATATATGVATWFAINIFQSLPSFSSNSCYSPCFAFVGTCGLAGSGSDIELGSCDITSGEIYRINQIIIPLPTRMTW